MLCVREHNMKMAGLAHRKWPDANKSFLSLDWHFGV
jgi:hypothetical protein